MDREFWSSFSHDPRDEQFRSMRASDLDRAVVEQALTEAYADGRLDREELDERTEQVTGSRTLGELAPIVADLVPPDPRGGGLARATPAEIERLAAAKWRSDVREALGGFLIPSIICTTIWAIVMFGGLFWPGFVMLGTGINLVRVIVRRQDVIAHHVSKLERKQAKELGKPWTPGDRAAE